MLMIAARYEYGDDVDTLRRDPMFKLAMGRLPDDGDLCSQPTISRLENLPDTRALLRMGRAMVDHYCHGFRQVPRRIVLDIDDTFDAMYGVQQLWLFNAIMVNTASRPRVEIMLRADSHYCTPEVLRFCRARRPDYTLGVAPTSTLRKHVLGFEGEHRSPRRQGCEWHEATTV